METIQSTTAGLTITARPLPANADDTLAADIETLLSVLSMNRRELADLLGVSSKQIGRWIKGDARPGARALARLEAVLLAMGPVREAQRILRSTDLPGADIDATIVAAIEELVRLALSAPGPETIADAVQETPAMIVVLRRMCRNGEWTSVRDVALAATQTELRADSELQAQYWNLAGVAEMKLGAYESAKQHYEKALSLASDELSLRIVENLASLWKRAGHFDRALDALNEVLKADPKSESALYNGLCVGVAMGSDLIASGFAAKLRSTYPGYCAAGDVRRESMFRDSELQSAVENGWLQRLVPVSSDHGSDSWLAHLRSFTQYAIVVATPWLITASELADRINV